jgi:hypothetical protein
MGITSLSVSSRRRAAAGRACLPNSKMHDPSSERATYRDAIISHREQNVCGSPSRHLIVDARIISVWLALMSAPQVIHAFPAECIMPDTVSH